MYKVWHSTVPYWGFATAFADCSFTVCSLRFAESRPGMQVEHCFFPGNLPFVAPPSICTTIAAVATTSVYGVLALCGSFHPSLQGVERSSRTAGTDQPTVMSHALGFGKLDFNCALHRLCITWRRSFLMTWKTSQTARVRLRGAKQTSPYPLFNPPDLPSLGDNGKETIYATHVFPWPFSSMGGNAK